MSRKEQPVSEFIHPLIDQEVEAIGGRYVVLKEELMDFQGRQVLYLVASASFDSTCCGNGGCAYAIVPGFLVEFRAGRHDDGTYKSLVEPIVDEGAREDLKAGIMAREHVSQVNFL